MMKKICFTGKMPEVRTYYERIAKQKGFIPVKSVTQDLHTLVCMNPNSETNKMRNARRNGTKIISVGQFMSTNSTPTTSEDECLIASEMDCPSGCICRHCQTEKCQTAKKSNYDYIISIGKLYDCKVNTEGCKHFEDWLKKICKV